MGKGYVHGYTDRESERLSDQARILSPLLHDDTCYPPGSRVLEAGCGTGAQTITLAENSPGASITSVDISHDSLKRAGEMVRSDVIPNVSFCQGDIFHLPFPDGTFDHIFICFVLEHLAGPQVALERLRLLLKPGGTITVIEGDHGSAFFHPPSRDAQDAIDCLVRLQQMAGGDGCIGRRLYPLVTAAGFGQVVASPRMVYADASRPSLVDGFIRQTFTAMVEAVGDAAVGRGMIGQETWDRGVRDLYRTCEGDGVFCYTFFKATGIRP